MEKAREVATERARYHSQIVAFINKNVSGLERRIARHGTSSLFGHVLEALNNGVASVVDGKYHMTEQGLREWSLDDKSLRMLHDTYYTAQEGRIDELLQLGVDVLRASERVVALVPTLRALFSDEGRHDTGATASKVINWVQHYSTIIQWACNLGRGRHADRLECSWYYMYPRYETTLEQHMAACTELCDAMFGMTVEEVASTGRFSLHNATPMGKMDQIITRLEAPEVTAGGFVISSRVTERVLRVLRQFNVLSGDQQFDVHRALSTNVAAIHCSGQTVLCYANARDFERGRCSVMPMARWLRSFGDVDDAGIQKVVNALRVSDITFYKDYSEWYKAYVLTPDMGSCMAYAPCHFEVFEDGEFDAPGTTIPMHPVWCYAEHEYVRLAVILRGDDVVARAVVHTGHKRFYRVYGDYALHAALTCAGYTEDEDFLEDTVLRSYLVNGKHLLHPYVDGHYSEADVTIIDNEYAELHLTNNGDYDMQNTDGGRRYFREAEYHCEVCDCTHRDGDDNEVIDGYGTTIYEVCSSCSNATVSAYDEDDRRYSNVLESGTERCAISGDVYIRSALVYSEYHDNLVAPSELRRWEEDQQEEDDE